MLDKLINYVYSLERDMRRITEENLNVEVTDFKILDANTFEVFTYEEFNIYSPKKDEDEFRAFKSDYKVKVDAEGNFKVNTLVKTKEIK